MGDIQIHCKYDALLEVSKLRAYKKNRNQHTTAQVERLAKILEYQGLRAPVVVVGSVAGVTDGKTIAKGHCTVEAIKKNGWLSAPIVFQNFDNEEQLYAYVQSDNAIANWSELDIAGINADIGELGPDLDIDLLGLENFFIDASEKSTVKEYGSEDFQDFKHKCPKCGFEFDKFKDE